MSAYESNAYWKAIRMPLMLMSNPGLPLAVLGNPQRRGRKGRKNPLYRYSVRKGARTSASRVDAPSLSRARAALAKQFPGWSIESLGGAGYLKKTPKRRARRAVRKTKPATHRRLARKAKAARRGIARRSRTMARSKTYRLNRIRRRFARKVVGRTFGKKGSRNWIKVRSARVHGKKMKRTIKHKAVKWSGRRGFVSYIGKGRRNGGKVRKLRFTNPLGGVMAGVKDYGRTFVSAPTRLIGKVKAPSIKSIGFLAGGTVATYLAGGVVSTFISPLLNKIPGVGGVLAKPMVQRVVGAAFPFTAGFVLSKVVPAKYADVREALVLGGFLASVVEVLVPGGVRNIMLKIPGVNKLAGMNGFNGLQGPVDGLAGYFGVDHGLAAYVEAPGYQGTGEYVEAPSYQGTGEDMLAAYVEDKSQRLQGDDAVLAGYEQVKSYSGSGIQGYLDAPAPAAQSFLVAN